MAYDPKRHLEALVELLLSGYLSIACISIASNFFKPNGWLAKLRGGILLPACLSLIASFADRWRAIGVGRRSERTRKWTGIEGRTRHDGLEVDADALQRNRKAQSYEPAAAAEIARQSDRSLGRV